MGINNGKRVAAAKPKIGGGLYWAPLGTALPTDASTTLAAEYIPLGPIHEEGITPSRDTSVEKVKEWDGSTLAQLLSDESRSFETLLYGVHDADVLRYLFSDANVEVVAASGETGTTISVKDVGGKPENAVLVMEMQYRGVKMRKVLPDADATITGEEAYQGSALMGFTLSVECLKDDSGVRVYEYSELNDAPGA